MKMQTPALDGLKIVEFAHVIAGPLAGTLMADLGATVVHVEDPEGGDSQRRAGPTNQGIHLWWKVAARNKRSITLNLRTGDGREVARELVAWADVVITNFRVDTLAKWELDFESLRGLNPKVIMLQITGFGATSSRRNEPGFGKVGEAMSGVVHLTGFAGGPPVHTGFSHGDAVTGLMGAFAVQAALYRRSQDPDFRGEWIDLALYDGLFRLIEWQVVMFDQLGVVPERVGNKLAAAPAIVVNLYRTRDERWLTVTSGTPRSVSNAAILVGESAADYDTREKQAERSVRLDSLVGQWIAERNMEECLSAMKEAGVVASPIYSMKDILEDETYRERESVVTVQDPDLGPLRMQGVVPRMDQHGGRVWRSAPALGEDNDLVYGQWLGKSRAELERLRSQGDI